MTTIALGPLTTATSPVRRADARQPATRLRLTARGRAVLTAVAAVPAVLVILGAIWGGGAALASLDPAAPAGTFETVTVSSGDSLWSIAEEIAPDADPRDVVSDIARLNGLTGSVVSAGQRLAIPAVYSQ
ncbi:MAG: LysM peptidoglycan-binding domain-containing protein [Microbacterium sp.]|mgnify:CR=1 FL=1|uniref:LysM peptidoglycan-binding domain-containing protein n=1 Tax=Microbacterium sp. TaxID=51671 RepID=UPI003242648F